MKDLVEGHSTQFVEVLNDTWDYLFLADPQTLRRFQTDNELPEDLLTEFTSQESGDRAVEQGALIPLSGIDNLPYVVYFTTGADARLQMEGADLQHHQPGYRLRVDSGFAFLFTVPYLQQFNAEAVDRLVEAGKKGYRQMLRLPAGWYAVDVLAGQTRHDGELEPTLEFVLRRHDDEPPFTASVNYAYRVRVDRY